MEAVNVIEAHNSPLSCIALNNDGTLLATASEKGTIIRVFSIPDAQKLYQFRRGSIPARIYSMSFNSTSTLLSVSSATETVHIFRLGAPNSRSNSVSSGPTRPMAASQQRSSSRTSQEIEDEFGSSTADVSSPERKAVNPTFGGYLPSAVAEIWEPSRDFAWVKIPRSPNSSSSGPVRNVVALNNNGPQIMVVTSEGNYYVFNVDLEKGGEGTLYKQYS
jgi:autophagy-related protein 18